MKNAQKLMKFEAQIRACQTVNDVGIESVNLASELLEAPQVILFDISWGRPRIKFGSNVSSISKDSPLIQDITYEIEQAVRRSETNTILNFQLDTKAETAAQMPFGAVTLWEDRKENIQGGMVFLADRPWTPESYQLATYFSEFVYHAYRALSGAKRFNPKKAVMRFGVLTALIASLCALWFVKLPISIMAPARVVAKDPTTVAATLSGIIDEVRVQPAQIVHAGMVLATLDDADLKAELDRAEQNYAVAAAKFENMSRQALTRPNSRRELAIVEAEMELANVERIWARKRLDRTEIRAPRDGVISIDTPQDLIGRPVDKGTALFDIVDPKQIELRVDVPVDDSRLMYQLSNAEAFLNSAPLTARPLRTKLVPHSPILDDRGGVSYPLILDFSTPTIEKIGSEGYVQLRGPTERLYYVLLRRPLMWMRRVMPFGLWQG